MQGNQEELRDRLKNVKTRFGQYKGNIVMKFQNGKAERLSAVK